jgi:hypothetical protein
MRLVFGETAALFAIDRTGVTIALLKWKHFPAKLELASTWNAQSNAKNPHGEKRNR